MTFAPGRDPCPDGRSVRDKLVDCGSAVGATLYGVGPGLGLCGEAKNYAHFHWPGKAILTGMMLLGRLELFVLLALFVTGAWALAAADGFAASMRGFVKAVFTADLSVETSGILAAHIVVALLFLAYLPFTQMMHFVAKYFTYHQVRWEEEPLTAGGRLEAEANRLLEQPVTWGAPHVNANGSKNWVDVATEEMKS